MLLFVCVFFCSECLFRVVFFPGTHSPFGSLEKKLNNEFDLMQQMLIFTIVVLCTVDSMITIVVPYIFCFCFFFGLVFVFVFFFAFFFLP